VGTGVGVPVEVGVMDGSGVGVGFVANALQEVSKIRSRGTAECGIVKKAYWRMGLILTDYAAPPEK
jgi:hypothetical protein